MTLGRAVALLAGDRDIVALRLAEKPSRRDLFLDDAEQALEPHLHVHLLMAME